MLINLFEDKNLVTKSGKLLGYMTTQRPYELADDLTRYDSLSSEDLDTRFHLESVKDYKGLSRTYTNIFGCLTDSHNEIEKLGVCKGHKRWNVIVSLEDSLDYILHRLCGADMNNIRNMPNYKQVSRALLKLNYEAMVASFGDLREADEKVDSYFTQLFSSTETEDLEEAALNFQKTFVLKIMSQLSTILEYVVLAYYYDTVESAGYKKGALVLRSKSLCCFVLSSDVKIEEELIIKSPGFEDYTLKIHSFEKYEYLEKMSLEYA